MTQGNACLLCSVYGAAAKGPTPAVVVQAAEGKGLLTTKCGVGCPGCLGCKSAQRQPASLPAGLAPPSSPTSGWCRTLGAPARACRHSRSRITTGAAQHLLLTAWMRDDDDGGGGRAAPGLTATPANVGRAMWTGASRCGQGVGDGGPAAGALPPGLRAWRRGGAAAAGQGRPGSGGRGGPDDEAERTWGRARQGAPCACVCLRARLPCCC